MSDQKIMDMFVEQSTEILELKGKLRIAIQALKDAHHNACSCCDSNQAVNEHCEEALLKIGAIDEKN